MIDLPRRPPVPIPTVRPLPEYLATGDLKDKYEDMKAVFQVPWMGVVTMAYAHYPRFYDTLWAGARPLCASHAFVTASVGLRQLVEHEVVRLSPPPLVPRLEEAGYAPREIDNIRAMVEVLSHGNFPYLILATITRYLLEGGEMSTVRDAPGFAVRHAPDAVVPFVLMEPHHADPSTRAVYEEVKATLKLPFVNTDYRALSRWPSYFAMAWRDLKDVAGGPAHEALAERIHGQALDLARTLPNPGGLTSTTIREAAADDATLNEVLQMSRLFQWLLPGLVTNVAYLRHQLRQA